MSAAVRDALATARIRLAEERRAAALCAAHGWTTDAAFAAAEADRYARLVAALEARLARQEAQ